MMPALGSEITKTKQKLREKSKASNRRIARTRRQRGYNWEDTIVKRFNSSGEWKAFRLGSPSVGLPDILAVSTKENTIYTKYVWKSYAWRAKPKRLPFS